MSKRNLNQVGNLTGQKMNGEFSNKERIERLKLENRYLYIFLINRRKLWTFIFLRLFNFLYHFIISLSVHLKHQCKSIIIYWEQFGAKKYKKLGLILPFLLVKLNYSEKVRKITMRGSKFFFVKHYKQ